MPLTCAIVDDDPFSSILIEKYCSQIPNLQLEGVYHDPIQANKQLSLHAADLIFLDVKMPGLNGFDLLDALNYRPMVIMTTGEEEYAYLAFEYQVVDFLKKPIGFERFRRSIQKAFAWNEQAPNDEASDVFIRHHGELVRIPFTEISYVQAVGDYIKVFTTTKQYLVQSTLKNFEDKLSGRLFVKAHRSFVVNISKVQHITGQKLVVQQQDIPISRSQKSEVYKKLNIL